MDFGVRPGEGVGDLDFGMTREEVAGILGKPDSSVKQNQFAKEEMDVFGKLGITTHYDNEGLSMVEFSGPATPTYQDEELLEVGDALDWIEGLDEEAQLDPPDVVSEKLSIAFYVEESKVISVGIFSPGYYD